MVKLPLLPLLCLHDLLRMKESCCGAGPAELTYLGNKSGIEECPEHPHGSSRVSRGLPAPPPSPVLGRHRAVHLHQGCSINTGWEEHSSHLEQTPASRAVWRPCPLSNCLQQQMTPCSPMPAFACLFCILLYSSCPGLPLPSPASTSSFHQFNFFLCKYYILAYPSGHEYVRQQGCTHKAQACPV